MKLKQLLLTSTAMLMLGTPVAPLFAQSGNADLTVAQAAPPALAGAIQTYLEAQAAVEAAQASGGDAAAAEEALAVARDELGALCAAIGQTDIDACIAMFEKPNPLRRRNRHQHRLKSLLRSKKHPPLRLKSPPLSPNLLRLKSPLLLPKPWKSLNRRLPKLLQPSPPRLPNSLLPTRTPRPLPPFLKR